MLRMPHSFRSVFREGLFAGQAGIVTGAGSGLGRCTAHELVAPCAQTPEKWLATLKDAPEVFVGTGAFAHRDMLRASYPGVMIVEGAAMYPSTTYLAKIAHGMSPLDAVLCAPKRCRTDKIARYRAPSRGPRWMTW